MEYLTLFWIFCKIGLFTIGGGMAMLPLVQQELVARGYMTLSETVDMVAVSQMTPGPFAVNAATFVGMRMYGVGGAAVATLGVTLPSVIITLLVARFFFSFHKKSLVRGALAGVRPVVLALILAAALSVARESLFFGGTLGWASADWASAALAAAGLCALVFAGKRVSPVGIVAICGLIGGVFLSGSAPW